MSTSSGLMLLSSLFNLGFVMAIIDKGLSYAHLSASIDHCPTTAASAETSSGSILYQINLGQHHLVLRDDQSIKLAHNDKTEQPS